MVPANDFIEEGLEHTALVGDGVLANVHAVLLQGLLHDGWHVLPMDFTGKEKLISPAENVGSEI